MISPTITISVAVCNMLHTTQQCMAALRDIPNAEVIVVDNGSDAEMRDWLQRQGWFRVIRNEANVGFGMAHNQVAAIAQGWYLLVLNNDLVMREEVLTKMRTEFDRDPNLGAVGLRGGCSGLNSAGTGVPQRPGDEPEYVEGSCLMMPTKLAREFGPFDSDYYRVAYYEDADLSLRLRRAGYSIAIVEDKLAGGRSITADDLRRRGVDLDGYIVVNRMRFQRRWYRYLERRSFEENILLMRDAAMGDVLLTTPVIRQLKLDNPGARVIVSTKCGTVLMNNPNVAATTSGAMDTRSFDRCIDLNSAYENCRPAVHIVDAYADVAKVKLSSRRPEIFPSRDDVAFAERLHSALGGKPYAVVHADPTAWAGRNLPIETLRLVAHSLARDFGLSIVLVGLSPEVKLPYNANLIGKTSLMQMAAVIGRAVLHIGIDSMPFHLAQAAGVPAVVAFGCIDPRHRIVDDNLVISVIASGVACLGCHHEQMPPAVCCDCRRESVYCMEKIRADDMLAAAEKFLNRNRVESHYEQRASV